MVVFAFQGANLPVHLTGVSLRFTPAGDFSVRLLEERGEMATDPKKQARIEEVRTLLNAFSQEHLSSELSEYVHKLWEQIGLLGSDQTILLSFRDKHPKSRCFQLLNHHFQG